MNSRNFGYFYQAGLNKLAAAVDYMEKRALSDTEMALLGGGGGGGALLGALAGGALGRKRRAASALLGALAGGAAGAGGGYLGLGGLGGRDDGLSHEMADRRDLRSREAAGLNLSAAERAAIRALEDRRAEFDAGGGQRWSPWRP